MRVRPVHLATLLLLLATFGVADASALSPGGLRPGVPYASAAALLAKDSVRVAKTARSAGGTASSSASHNTLVHFGTAWTMRPPAAHAARVHAVTASGI